MPVSIKVQVENSDVEPLTTDNFKLTESGNNIDISEIETTSTENEYNLSVDFSTLTTGSYNVEVAYVESGETKATDMLAVNITQ